MSNFNGLFDSEEEINAKKDESYEKMCIRMGDGAKTKNMSLSDQKEYERTLDEKAKEKVKAKKDRAPLSSFMDSPRKIYFGV